MKGLRWPTLLPGQVRRVRPQTHLLICKTRSTTRASDHTPFPVLVRPRRTLHGWWLWVCGMAHVLVAMDGWPTSFGGGGADDRGHRPEHISSSPPCPSGMAHVLVAMIGCGARNMPTQAWSMPPAGRLVRLHPSTTGRFYPKHPRGFRHASPRRCRRLWQRAELFLRMADPRRDDCVAPGLVPSHRESG